MNGTVLSLFAETSLHPGIGQIVGAVDLPVARERATGYPVIFGSSLKGALREKCEKKLIKEQNEGKDGAIARIFGQAEQAGSLLISDARILLLPVRSIPGPFRWITCPHILERLKRDLALVGITKDFQIPNVQDRAFVHNSSKDSQVFLEEIVTDVQKDDSIEKIVEVLENFIPHDFVKKRFKKQFMIIDDEEFQYFAQYGLQVNARNVLDEKKISLNLWYEELIPHDTLFYSLIFERKLSENQNDIEVLKRIFTEDKYLQIGGNETIGQGWCTVTFVNLGGGEKK